MALACQYRQTDLLGTGGLEQGVHALGAFGRDDFIPVAVEDPDRQRRKALGPLGEIGRYGPGAAKTEAAKVSVAKIAAPVVKNVENAPSAIKAMAEANLSLQRADLGSFSLLITDLQMPTMDGIELIRRAQERHPDLPAILVTAHASIESAVDAMRSGAVDYVPKPFRLSTMISTVERALALHYAYYRFYFS